MSAAEAVMDQYLPIQNLDIEAESRINFNLYVNLPLNNKYILYRKAGDSLESNRLEKFNEVDSNIFFIHKNDYGEYVKYVANRIKNLLGIEENFENQKNMHAAAKAILSSTLDQRDPAIAAALMNNLNDITGSIIETSLDNLVIGRNGTPTKLFKKLIELAEKGSDFQRHPINVTSLAILISFGIGYSREKLLADVAMAALLHDVGLTKLPPRLIANSHQPLNLSIADRKLLYDHPKMSVDVLIEKEIPISSLAMTLILQHHEEFNGSGYPKGLRGYHINELAQIIHVADAIDNLFTEFFLSPGYLKIRVAELLRDFDERKVIESQLLGRIRQVLI